MTGHSDFPSQPLQNGNGVAEQRQFGTLAVHAGAPHDPVTGAVIEPVSFLTFWCLSSMTQLMSHTDLPFYHICANQRRKTHWCLRIYSQLEP